MPQHDNAFIIRTHDRMAFLECRQAWDWGSKIRSNLEANKGNLNMDFGTSIHAAAEGYYDPKTWGHPEVQAATALTAFQASWRTFYEAHESVWEEHYDLGVAMIPRYCEWASKADQGFTPMYVELEFEVPIIVPKWLILPVGFMRGEWNHLLCMHDGEWWPVYYQGRCDLIFKDDKGYYWIVDHKTASSLSEDTSFLEMDEQTGSYCWALQHMLSVPIRGVIYSEWLKSVPEPPKVLKNGSLSQDKRQNTTYEIYQKTLDERGLSVVGYTDHLQWLQDNPRTYFRRTDVPRSSRELELLGERICVEAIDMLNDPAIYPAPTRFKCGRCAFRSACLVKMDGSDYNLILNEDFHVRT